MGDGRFFLVSRSDNACIADSSPIFTTATVELGGWYLPQPAPNPDGLSGQVWVAVDRSTGPRRGAVYLLCSVVPDDGASGAMVVRFAASFDRGETWSEPVSVAPPDSGIYQWFGTMSVAPNGRIDALWVQSLDPARPSIGELRYATSADGGSSWSAAVPISPVFDSHLGWPQQQRLGDYIQMVSDNLGADLAYAATVGGEQNIYYLRIGDRDCNRNDRGDSTEIAAGMVRDCNGNSIPDSCEIAAGAEPSEICETPPRPRRPRRRHRSG